MGVPLESVTVVSENNHTITDQYGYFKLEVYSDFEKIDFRYLGYESQTLYSSDFDKENCVNIYLKDQIETLSEIVLTNYITTGIDKVADGSFNINFSNFGILPGLIEADVFQTIQALPGIQSVDETVSNISIRGGTNDQNLILWDGIKMYQSGHFFGLISVFNPSITTDVMVIKNGTNVDYSDGVSGTIAMKTDSEINETFSGSMATNFIDADAFVDIPLGDQSSIQLSVRGSINGFVETPTYKKYAKRILQDSEIEANTGTNKESDIEFNFFDTSLRWLFDITEKDHIRVNLFAVNNNLIVNESAIVDGEVTTKESGLEQNSYAGGIFYKRNWNDYFTTSLQLYETDYILNGINSDIENQQVLEQENKVSETSIKLNAWYKYNGQFSFLNGYQVTETAISNYLDTDAPPYFQLIREVVREHAAYTQVNYKSPSKNTILKAGIRYNFIEQFQKHIIEPRFSLNQKLVDFLTLEVLGEFKHQNSSQIINFQNDFLGIEKRRWQLTEDNNIPIARSKQLSLGLNFNYSNWLVSTDAYYKKVNGISSLSQGFLNQYIYEIANGSYTVKGIDFLVRKKMQNFNTWLSYSYALNNYEFKSFPENEFLNNIDITHAFNFGVSYTKNKFKISTGFNSHTGKPTTNPIPNNEVSDGQINYQAANSDRIKNYLRVDASATYKFKLSEKVKARAGISVWNGLNNTNIINNYYTLDNDDNLSKVSNKALELTPNFSFRVFF